jgi:predicted ester cyclase
MSTEENKAIVRRVNKEVIDQGNMSVVDELFALDFVAHPTPPGIPPGREGFKQLHAMYSSAFSDIKTTIHDIIAEGDLVATHVTFDCTHTGAFMGIPPTGKRVAIEETSFSRIVDGKIAEWWGDNNLMQQLVGMPAPAASGS